MTGYDYSRLRTTAERLISRFGKTAGGALMEPGIPTGPSYDPTPGAPTIHQVQVLILDYGARDIDGSRILATDKRIYVAVGALTIQPKTDWTLAADGVTYRIISVNTLQPGDAKLLWDLQCRA